MRKSISSKPIAAAPFALEGVGILSRSNGSDRLISYIFSDQSVARDGHTIKTDGINLKPFMRNPVFQWAHDQGQPPIGKIIDIGPRGTQLVGTVEYAERDVYPFADTVFQLVKKGFLNATSISWIPHEWAYSSDKSRPGGIDFTKVELLEVSQVPVPALSTALVTARAQGIDTGPLYDWTERMLDCGNPVLPRNELETLRREAKMPASLIRRSPSRTLAERRVRAEALQSADRSTYAAIGRFIADIVRDAEGTAPLPPHLVRAASETDPTAGGVLVPEQYLQTFLTPVYETSELMALVDTRETSAPLASVELPGIDETSRAAGSRWGGMLSTWLGESANIPASFPRTKMLEFSGRKLAIFVRATRELISDAPLFGAHVAKGFAAVAGADFDTAVLTGTGAGVPLGILNSPALITVAKEGGQAAGTIVSENVNKMWSRLPAPCRKRAVWLCNEDAEGQFEGIGGASGAAMYVPQGVGGNEYPLLKGRPVIVLEQSPILGTAGDITLVDPSQYIVIDGGAQTALSVHAHFDTDEVVLRFIWRLDGKGAYSTPITPYNGSSTRSPFVTLGAR